MKFVTVKNILIIVVIAGLLAGGTALLLYKNKFKLFGQAVASSSSTVVPTADVSSAVVQPPAQKLQNPPAIIKAIYVTGYSASSKTYLNYLTTLFKNTEINAVVVDIKGSDGYVTYASGAPDVKKYDTDYDMIKNIDDLVNFFHSQNIYVIGRIATFEDPMYAKARPDIAIYDTTKTTDPSKPVLWENKDGLAWLDPASEDAWAYNVSLAKDAFAHGFDEVNFDYVRFPTDGDTANMGFPKWDEKTLLSTIIKNFFVYVRTNLPGEKISLDVFGQTTVDKNDMGIGQLLENTFENADYVSPMVYPSHYVDGFMGFANPADHPYEVIKYNLDSALTREETYFTNQQAQNSNTTEPSSAQTQPPVTDLSQSGLAKFRPWLQDFNLGAYYTPDMVEQEIKATEDALGSNFNGFMLWNASNVYTQAAVLKPN